MTHETNKVYDRMRIGEAVGELTFFAACSFVLTKAAIDDGAVLRGTTHLSQEVPQGLLLGVLETG